MTPLPPARGAAIRGDDYQHVIGLHCALEVLNNDDLASVSIEDAHGGAFDDIVVRPIDPTRTATRYIQVKSGVYNNVVIDHDWLTTPASPQGATPLQQFFRTWQERTSEGDPFVLEMLSNKNYDHKDPILQHIDHLTRQIPLEKLHRLTPRSRGGEQLTSWAQHVGVDQTTFAAFLTSVRFVHSESEGSWTQRCAAQMRIGGFRSDQSSVLTALAMVREWVKRGAGERTKAAIAAELHDQGLAAVQDHQRLLLQVNCIDTVTPDRTPDAILDFVDLYAGSEPFDRRALANPDDWHERVLPAVDTAKNELLARGSRDVELVAAMRLPMYFAIGRAMPRVGNWVVSTSQRGVEWSTDVDPVPAEISVAADATLSDGQDLAVLIELTLLATEDVRAYVAQAVPSVGRFVSLSLPNGADHDAVPAPGWARDWVRQAREHIRMIARETKATRVHLFIAAPAGMALFLGHDWNLIPTTTVYEHDGAYGYTPTVTLRG